jgi:hypothetical protein
MKKDEYYRPYLKMNYKWKVIKLKPLLNMIGDGSVIEHCIDAMLEKEAVKKWTKKY